MESEKLSEISEKIIKHVVRKITNVNGGRNGSTNARSFGRARQLGLEAKEENLRTEMRSVQTPLLIVDLCMYKGNFFTAKIRKNAFSASTGVDC